MLATPIATFFAPRNVAAACATTLLPCVALGAAPAPPTTAIPIQHVIMILQENRSFDNYFGTFPGADTIPQGTCVPLDPANPEQGCVVPYHDVHDANAGGRHHANDAQADIDDGITTAKMDGFVHQQIVAGQHGCARVGGPYPPSNCGGFTPGVNRHDAVGYHTDAELPNYWAYARHYVLQDALFESVRGYSLAAHLGATSEWSAKCKDTTNIATCVTDPYGQQPHKKAQYPWVNLFELMDRNSVSWKYYLGTGSERDCDDGDMTCAPQIHTSNVFSFWNPVAGYSYVQAQGQQYLAAHTPKLDQFLVDLKLGTLPQVSWLVPAEQYSEHPANSVTAGMEYVTSLVNAVMQSPYWANTAIYITWDDWGGFYDHVIPPIVDYNQTKTPVQGYGLRVPGLMLSAYAQAGLIDHGIMSFDAYATLIEDLFMNSTRLDPVQMGEPDARPTIRDELTTVKYPDGSTAPIGKLINEFDFTQTPLPPLVLSTHIPVAIKIACNSADKNNPQDCVGNNVTVSWASVAGGQVPGPFTYQVLRDGVALPSCLTANHSCVDSGVPSGTHYYTAYSIDPNNTASPASAAAEADVP
jgi:phospholipase C